MSGRTKDISSSFGARIRSIRLSRGITQKELGKMVNKGESTVRMWELGRSEPDIETLKLLAKGLEVSIDNMLNDNELESINVSISRHEADVITAYRQRPEMQIAIDKLLGILDDGSVRIYTAANSKDNKADRIIYMRKEEWERIKNAPETDDPLL